MQNKKNTFGLEFSPSVVTAIPRTPSDILSINLQSVIQRQLQILWLKLVGLNHKKCLTTFKCDCEFK